MSSDTPVQPQPADYRDAYALDCAPFENRIDTRFFYASTALMQRLDLLTHLTQFGESVVLVTGPAGSGKTTLLESFVAQANNRWQLCVHDANEQDQVRERLVSALGDGPDARMEDALARWDAQADPSQLFVIVVDNAEQLDKQSCDELCGLISMPQGERIRILLFGTDAAQPRVQDALAGQAPDRSLQLLEMPRLSEEETASYLMYRLAVAGYSGESPFAATEVRAICKAADGRPAAINQLAHQTLTEHMLRARSRRRHPLPSTGRIRGPLWMAATGGLLIVVAYVAWQRSTPPQDSSEPRPQLAEAPLERELPLNIPQPAEVEASSPATLVTTPPADLPDRIAENIDTGDDTSLADVETIDLSEGGPAQEPAADTPASPASPPSTDTANALPSAPDDVREPGLPADKPTALPAADGAQLPAGEPPQTREGPHRETWLLQQAEDRYSLQLLGSRSEQAIARFIEQHELDLDKTAYYRGRYNDAPWYVLMYGVYASRDAALQQVETLPPAIRKEKPWPRDIRSVHQAIQEGSQQ